MSLTASYNAPSREYLVYPQGVEGVAPARVTDAEVDALAADQQRAAFDDEEKARELHEKTVGGTFAPRHFSPTPPSHQQVRERLALELGRDKLAGAGYREDAPAPVEPEPPADPPIPAPPAP